MADFFRKAAAPRSGAGPRRRPWFLLALLLLVVGCAPAGPPDPGVIHFVTWKPNAPAAWRAVYQAFEARYPQYHLALEIGPHSSSNFHDLLTQKLKNRSTDVDVFLMDVVWPAEFASAGWARPLDDLFPPAEQAKFQAGAIAANTWQGHIYGVPLYLDAGLLYYRRDLLAAHGFHPPATWPELVTQARAVMAGESRAGRQVWGYSGQFKQYEGLICNMQEFILSAGGRLLADHGRRCGLTSPAALGAVAFVRQEIIGSLAPRGVLTYQEPESLALFLQGRAVFLRNWPYAWRIVNDPAQSRVAGRVGLASLPHFPGQAGAASLGGWQVGISAYSRNPAGAWALVSFLTGPEGQAILARAGGLTPSRPALYDDPGVLAAMPQLTAMKAALAQARPRPLTPLYPAVSDQMQIYFHQALAGRDDDPAARAAAACREIDGLLALTRGEGR